MRQYNKKIKAFTLIELIVVLLLTSLVITITFYTFQVAKNYYLHFDKKENQVTALIRFNAVLQSDFTKSQYAEGNSKVVTCYFEKKQISYRFMNEYIIREQVGVRDTFYCQASHLKYFFENAILMSDQRVIDEFQFFDDQAQINYHFKKVYATADLMLNDLK